MIRVLVADDHGIVRTGLRLLMEKMSGVEVVGEASTGHEAVRLAAELKPEIVIMDVAMPMLNGIEATVQILRENRRRAVIIMSMHADESYILRAIDAGARGYLLKDTADDDLEPAIHSVLRGKTFFSPAVAQTIVEDYVRMMRERHVQDSFDLLTDREKQVLQLLAEGRSNKEAAAILNLSPYTVETHRTNLMQKLDLHNTAELVLYAVRKSIVTA